MAEACEIALVSKYSFKGKLGVLLAAATTIATIPRGLRTGFDRWGYVVTGASSGLIPTNIPAFFLHRATGGTDEWIGRKFLLVKVYS